MGLSEFVGDFRALEAVLFDVRGVEVTGPIDFQAFLSCALFLQNLTTEMLPFIHASVMFEFELCHGVEHPTKLIVGIPRHIICVLNVT